MFQALHYYLQKKHDNPDYTWQQLRQEPELQHIYHYINTIPPHNNAESAGLWVVSLIIGLIGL